MELTVIQYKFDLPQLQQDLLYDLSRRKLGNIRRTSKLGVGTAYSPVSSPERRFCQYRSKITKKQVSKCS